MPEDDENKIDVPKFLESLLKQAQDTSKKPEPPPAEANTFYAAAALLGEVNRFNKGKIEISNAEKIIEEKTKDLATKDSVEALEVEIQKFKRIFKWVGIILDRGTAHIMALLALVLAIIGSWSEIKNWFSG